MNPKFRTPADRHFTKLYLNDDPVHCRQSRNAFRKGRLTDSRGFLNACPRRVLFLVTEDWYFWSHRLPIARALRDLGAEVHVMTKANSLREAIECEGFKHIPWDVHRRSVNPIREAHAFFQVVRTLHTLRPDLLHNIAIKPVAYGGLAALLTRQMPSVNTFAGMGHVFTSSSALVRLIRFGLTAIFRRVLRAKNTRIIVQNSDNTATLRALGIPPDLIRIIRGSGVDRYVFTPRPEPHDGPPLIILATRMLWEKGVKEFVDAAALLQERGARARFALVGSPDGDHSGSVPENQLREWQRQGLVEWWGKRDDMPNVIAQSNIVCFPSYYGEGIPKILLEAASCGRAIVTTHVPGCREVVTHGLNGLLVPPKNPPELAAAIDHLLNNPKLRESMGQHSTAVVTQEFSNERIIAATLQVYEELLGPFAAPLSAPIRNDSVECFQEHVATQVD